MILANLFGGHSICHR